MSEKLIPESLLGDVIVTKEEIAIRAKVLADQMRRDLDGLNPIMLCVKEGARFFFDDLCDLMKKESFQFEQAWIKTSSYFGNASVGNVTIKDYQGPDLAGRTVVIVEDIIDTALTVKALADHLYQSRAARVETCALLFKKRRQNWLWRKTGLRAVLGYPRIRYVGFFMGDHFVVGKGLDYDDYGREFNEVHVLLPDGQKWVDGKNNRA